MNLSAELISVAILFAIIFLTLVSVKRAKSPTTKTNVQPPEPAGAWPIIGHIHQLLPVRGNQLPHRKLAAMADECGPFFTVRLGSRLAFVVSNWKVAKECFTVSDKALSSRPEVSAAKFMCYDNTMFGFRQYDSIWREMRKTATVELLSARRLELLRHIRTTEVDMAIKELCNLWKKSSSPKPILVNVQEWFNHLMLNVIVKMVAGKRYTRGDDKEARLCRKGVAEFFRLYGISTVADELPGPLRWLDFLGLRRAMKKSAKVLDEIMEGWVEEHRQRRRVSGQQNIAKSQKDFIDVMLSLEEKGDLSGLGCEPAVLVKSTCLNMIFGGNDTTSGTLTWTIALLLNNRYALQKAQEELDLHVGLERLVDESDIPNLTYLQAIVKESLRLHPLAPLSAPREVIENCTIAGFVIPRGALVLFNLWKIQRDPKVWENPSMFAPERFLTSHAHVDPRSHNSELAVFGGGRRACAGSLFAIQVLHLTLARFIQAFEVATPFDQPVDMSECAGLTTHKATALGVLLTPRLSPKLYSL